MRHVNFCTAIFNYEEDIGTYTIRAVDDPRALNKVLYIRPRNNIYSFNDLVSLWEKKIGKTLEKEYISEDQLINKILGIFCAVIILVSSYMYIKFVFFFSFSFRVSNPTESNTIDPPLGFRERRSYKL